MRFLAPDIATAAGGSVKCRFGCSITARFVWPPAGRLDPIAVLRRECCLRLAYLLSGTRDAGYIPTGVQVAEQTDSHSRAVATLASAHVPRRRTKCPCIGKSHSTAGMTGENSVCSDNPHTHAKRSRLPESRIKIHAEASADVARRRAKALAQVYVSFQRWNYPPEARRLGLHVALR